MKKYQDNTAIFIINFITLLSLILILIWLYSLKFRTYKIVSASVIMDNVYQAIVDDEEVKCIQKNNYVYVNNKKKKIEVISVSRKYYKNYNQVLFRIKNKTEKLNMSIYDDKISFLDMFLENWEDDYEEDRRRKTR